MTKFRTLISSLFLFIIAVWSTQAQSQCAFDVEDIIARVSTECANIDANQVCYGNRNVTATPQLNVNMNDFIFNNPGDLVSLSSIQSLVVDSVNAQDNTWGVAQMRLLVGSGQGLQDVNMLLFGEFDVRNAVENTDTVELRVRVRLKNIHSLPDAQSDVLETIEANAVLTGLERLDDTSWLRVENTDTGVVGWTESAGVETIDEAQSIGILPVQEANTPYFGAMQAFYFENGNSDIGCDNVESDGLIIQTPEGQARVSLLINEVSIELVGTRNTAGENESGRAFIQADPSSPLGMSVNVLGGQATVQTDTESEPVSVVAGERTSIPISVNLNVPGSFISASGAPQAPVSFDTSSINVAPLLPVINNNSTSNSSGSSTINIGSNPTGSNNNTGSQSGSVNVNFGTNSGNTSDTSSGSNTVSSSGSDNSSQTSFFPSNSSSTGDNTVGNSSSSTNSSIIGSTSSQNTSQNTVNPGFGFGEQGNAIAAGIAIVGAIVLLGFIIWSAKQRN